VDGAGGGAGAGGNVVVVVVGGSVVVVVGGDVVLVVVGEDVVVVVGTGSWVVCVCAEVEGVLSGAEDAPTLVPAPSTMTRQRESKRTALANKTLPSPTVQRPLRTPSPTSLLSVWPRRGNHYEFRWNVGRR
jgi:hypothetical protein